MCTHTYAVFSDCINPFPANEQSIAALQDLAEKIIDPIIDYFGRDRFCLTYGFCSKDLKRYLSQKDPGTGQKYGRVAPNRDQHMAHEVNQHGKYYCDRLGAACDFFIQDLSSEHLVEWILAHRLPFDSLYYYGSGRPIHISYGPQHKRSIWGFSATGVPTQQGLQTWLEAARLIT